MDGSSIVVRSPTGGRRDGFGAGRFRRLDQAFTRGGVASTQWPLHRPQNLAHVAFCSLGGGRRAKLVLRHRPLLKDAAGVLDDIAQVKLHRLGHTPGLHQLTADTIAEGRLTFEDERYRLASRASRPRSETSIADRRAGAVAAQALALRISTDHRSVAPR